MNAISLAGSFGFGNVGDEAVVPAFQHLLLAAGARCHATPLSRWQRTPDPGVIDLGPESVEQRRSLRGSDLVICGGGIIERRGGCVLEQMRLMESEFEWGSLNAFAVNAERGAAESWLWRRRFRRFLARFETVVARDALSARALEVIVGREVEVVGDVVLSLPASDESSASGGASDDYLVLNLIPSWATNPRFSSMLAGEVVRLAIRNGCSVKIVPFAAEFDKDVQAAGDIASRLASELGEERVDLLASQPDLPSLRRILRHAHFVIAMRLHCCVLAAAEGVPFVALPYHDKIWGFLETMGLRGSSPQSWPRSLESQPGRGYAAGDLNDLSPGWLDDPRDTWDSAACRARVEVLRRAQAECVRNMFGKFAAAEPVSPTPVGFDQ